MPSVLVTGATGYLGGHVVEAFLDAGNEVTALVRPTSDTEALPDGVDAVVHSGGTEELAEALQQLEPTVVCHLASYYAREHVTSDVDGLIASNIGLCAELMEASATAGVEAVVNTGSYFQHYDSADYRPLNLYAASKQACQDMIEYYRDAGAFAATSLVLFDVYGPGDPRRKFLNAVIEAQRTGSPLRLPASDPAIALTHVADVAAAYVSASTLLLGGTPVEREYSVCGPDMTLRAIIAAFERVSGAPVPIADDVFELPERAITQPWDGPQLPGWEPAVDLETGIGALLEERGG